MHRTIIFLSGFMVPKFLAKSEFVWQNSLWKDYRRIYISSKTPTSDRMVARELKNLVYLTSIFPNVTVAGQSLGAWWAANLACEPEAKMKKLVFWTPLTDAQEYPIFTMSSDYHPLNRVPNPNHVGPHKSLLLYGNKDFIVPPYSHAYDLGRHFDSMNYELDGGHFFQTNHRAALHYMKDWIELG